MTLAEMMEELWGNLLRDTSTETTPDANSYLWNDATLLRYINDGYIRFCRKTEILVDDTTAAVVEITLADGTSKYALHASIINVESATVAGPNSEYYDLDLNNRDTVKTGTRKLSWVNPQVQNQSTGRPTVAWFDEATHSIRVYPTPDATYAGSKIYLRVARLPLEELTLGDPDAVPTPIPASVLEVTSLDYQLTILEWAAYRALRNHDVDLDGQTTSPMLIKASAHKKLFEESTDEARRHIKRLRRQKPRFGVDARTY